MFIILVLRAGTVVLNEDTASETENERNTLRKFT